MKIATPSPPPENSHPPLSQQPPSKSWGPVKPHLFENLVGGSVTSRNEGYTLWLSKANRIFQWIGLSNATLLSIVFFACGVHKLNYIKNDFV